VRWVGDFPCNTSGNRIAHLGENQEPTQIADGISATWLFSSKPPNGYDDYHHMMTRYIEIFENEAQAIDNSVTARKSLPWETEEEESVFRYLDTNTSQAGLTTVNAKRREERVGIIGVGGAGSYVLDLVAKSEVREIHLFDGDHLETHNAFRAPGAVSLEDLRTLPNKATYWAEKYNPLRRGIFAHDKHVTEENLNELDDLTFIFLCLDSGPAKKTIVASLEHMEKSFIDVGIGLEKSEGDSVFGNVRTTTSLPNMRAHFAKRVDYSDDGNNIYITNIQIADLNALNATLAVLRWKRIRGFYADYAEEANSVYMVEGNVITNEPS